MRSEPQTGRKQLIMMIGVPLGGSPCPFGEGGALAKPLVSRARRGRFAVINLPHPWGVPGGTPAPLRKKGDLEKDVHLSQAPGEYRPGENRPG